MMNLIDRQTEPYRLLIEQKYDHFVKSYFPNEMFAEFVISISISIGLYWTLGLVYFVVDYTHKPAFVYRFKIQNTTQVHTQNLSKFFRQIVSNQLLSAFLAFCLISFKYKYSTIQRSIPTLSRFTLEFTVFLLVRETLFYYSHLLLHHPALYRHIHKRHHEWQTPIALEAVYCHPIEHLVSNMLHIIVGPVLMHSHNLSGHLWTCFVIIWTMYAHCGYHFPLVPFSPAFHDYHHLKFNVNYGIIGLFDWFHGTDRLFRASKYYKLNRMYFGLSLPKDLVYDDEDSKVD